MGMRSSIFKYFFTVFNVLTVVRLCVKIRIIKNHKINGHHRPCVYFMTCGTTKTPTT